MPSLLIGILEVSALAKLLSGFIPGLNGMNRHLLAELAEALMIAGMSPALEREDLPLPAAPVIAKKPDLKSFSRSDST